MRKIVYTIIVLVLLACFPAYGLESNTNLSALSAPAGGIDAQDDKIYILDATGNTPSADTIKRAVMAGALNGVSFFYKDSTKRWFFVDPTSGTTIFENIPGEAGVSAQIKGGALYGIGNMDVYGYLTAGASVYPLNAAPGLGGINLGGTTTTLSATLAGALVQSSSAVTPILVLPTLASSSLNGTTTFFQFMDPVGSGVSICTPPAQVNVGSTIWVLDKNKFRQGTTLVLRSGPQSQGAHVQIQPFYNSVSGWAYNVTALSGVSWELWRHYTDTVNGDYADKLGTFIGMGAAE